MKAVLLKVPTAFPIVADVDSLDWKDYSAEKIVSRVTKKVQPGSICLFHNAAKNTPAALPSLIEKLQKDGYNLVPISDLIYKENYTLNVEGRQMKNLDSSTLVKNKSAFSKNDTVSDIK